MRGKLLNSCLFYDGPVKCRHLLSFQSFRVTVPARAGCGDRPYPTARNIGILPDISAPPAYVKSSQAGYPAAVRLPARLATRL